MNKKAAQDLLSFLVSTMRRVNPAGHSRKGPTMEQRVAMKDILVHVEAIRREADQLLQKMQALTDRLHHAEDAQLEAVFGTASEEAEEPTAV
jgi:hypothetical protein